MTENERFRTSDLPLAAFLISSGVKFLKIIHPDPASWRVEFVLENPEAKLLADWHSGEALINALAYHNSYQELKRLIYRQSGRV